MSKLSAELDKLIAKAREWEANATPEQKEAMLNAQRESWIRAFRPCEHGDYDWETCPECLAKYFPTPPTDGGGDA